MGLGVARRSPKRAAERLHPFRDVARPDQDDSQAVPGLTVGGVELAGLAKRCSGFALPAVLRCFHALPHKTRDPVAHGHGPDRWGRRGRHRDWSRDHDAPVSLVLRAQRDAGGESTHHDQNNQSPHDTPLTPGLDRLPQVWEAAQAWSGRLTIIHTHEGVREAAHRAAPSTMVGLRRPPTTRERAMAVRGPTMPSSWRPPTAFWKRRTDCWNLVS